MIWASAALGDLMLGPAKAAQAAAPSLLETMLRQATGGGLDTLASHAAPLALFGGCAIYLIGLALAVASVLMIAAAVWLVTSLPTAPRGKASASLGASSRGLRLGV